MYKFLSVPSIQVEKMTAFNEVVKAVSLANQFKGKDIIVLVGGSGAGKSTLTRMMLGEKPTKKVLFQKQLYTLEEWGDRKEKRQRFVYDFDSGSGPRVGCSRLSQTDQIEGFYADSLGAFIVDTQGFFDNRGSLGGLGTVMALKKARSVKFVFCVNYLEELDQTYRQTKSTQFLDSMSLVFNNLMGSDLDVIKQELHNSVLLVSNHLGKHDIEDVLEDLQELKDDFSDYDFKMACGRKNTDLLSFINRENQRYVTGFNPEDPDSLEALQTAIRNLMPAKWERHTLKFPLPDVSIRELELVLGNPEYIRILDAAQKAKLKVDSLKPVFNEKMEAHKNASEAVNECLRQMAAFEKKLPKGVNGGHSIESRLKIETAKKEKEWKSHQRFVSEQERSSTMSQEQLNQLRKNAQNTFSQLDSFLETLTKLKDNWALLCSEKEELLEIHRKHLDALTESEIPLLEAQKISRLCNNQVQALVVPMFSFLKSAEGVVESFPAYSTVSEFMKRCREFGVKSIQQDYLTLNKKPIFSMLKENAEGRQFTSQLHFETMIDNYQLSLSKMSFTGVNSFVVCLAQASTQCYGKDPIEEELLSVFDLTAIETQFHRLAVQMNPLSKQFNGQLLNTEALLKLIEIFQSSSKAILPPLALFNVLTGELTHLTSKHEPVEQICLLVRTNTDKFQVIVLAPDSSEDKRQHYTGWMPAMEQEGEFEKLISAWKLTIPEDQIADFEMTYARPLMKCATFNQVKDVLFSGDNAKPIEDAYGFNQLCESESALVGQDHRYVFKTFINTILEKIHDQISLEMKQQLLQQQKEEQASLQEIVSIKEQVKAEHQTRDNYNARLKEIDGYEQLKTSDFAIEFIRQMYEKYEVAVNISKMTSIQQLNAQFSHQLIIPSDITEESILAYGHHLSIGMAGRVAVNSKIYNASDTFYASGYFIKLSEVLKQATAWKQQEENKMWDAFWETAKKSSGRIKIWKGEKIKFFERIFTIKIDADIIYLDENMTWSGGDIELTAGYIVVTKVDHVTIDCSGKNAEDYPGFKKPEPKRGPNDYDGRHGKHGRDGQDGGRINVKASIYYDADKITFKSCGGNGSNGDKGEEGIEGRKGLSGEKGNITEQMKRVYFLEASADCFSVSSAHYAEGEKADLTSDNAPGKGGPGGNGGNGGAKGFGGESGEITVTTPGDVCIYAKGSEFLKNGDDGEAGIGGDGNVGGLDGKNGLWVGRQRGLFFIGGKQPIEHAELTIENKRWPLARVRTLATVDPEPIERLRGKTGKKGISEERNAVSQEKSFTRSQFAGTYKQRDFDTGNSDVETVRKQLQQCNERIAQGERNLTRKTEELQIIRHKIDTTYNRFDDHSKSKKILNSAEMISSHTAQLSRMKTLDGLSKKISEQPKKVRVKQDNKKKLSNIGKLGMYMGSSIASVGSSAVSTGKSLGTSVGSLFVTSAAFLSNLTASQQNTDSAIYMKNIDLSCLDEPQRNELSSIMLELFSVPCPREMKKIVLDKFKQIVHKISETQTSERDAVFWSSIGFFIMPIAKDYKDFFELDAARSPAVFNDMVTLRMSDSSDSFNKSLNLILKKGYRDSSELTQLFLDKAYELKLNFHLNIPELNLQDIDRVVKDLSRYYKLKSQPSHPIHELISLEEKLKVKSLNEAALTLFDGRGISDALITMVADQEKFDVMKVHFNSFYLPNRELVLWVYSLLSLPSDIQQPFLDNTARRVEKQLYDPLVKKLKTYWGIDLEALFESIASLEEPSLLERVVILESVRQFFENSSDTIPQKEKVQEVMLDDVTKIVATDLEGSTSADLINNCPIEERLSAVLRSLSQKNETNEKMVKKIKWLTRCCTVQSDEELDMLDMFLGEDW